MITGRELRELVAPMPVATFLETYWQKRSVFIKGQPKKFGRLFSREEFLDAMQVGWRKPSRNKFGIRIEGVWGFTPTQANDLFKHGMTICVSHISLGSRKLSTFAAAVQQQLSFAGGVRFNAYLSPEGKGVTYPHFDARVATTLQIEGRKRWKYAVAPAVPWPHAQASVNKQGKIVWSSEARAWERGLLGDELREPFEEVTLEPGDVLCLPAGTWHAAKAVDGPSLSLNLAFEPTPFLAILDEILKEKLGARPAWRAPPPTVHARSFGSGRVPRDVAQYFEARLAELKEVIAALEPDGLELNRAWRAATCDEMLVSALSPRGRVDDRRPVRRRDTFRVRADVPVTFALGKGVAVVFCANKSVELRGELAPAFLERLMHTRQFIAEDAVAWTGGQSATAWRSVKQMIARLVFEGLLTREPSATR